MNRTAENNVNYQERASEFAIGDVVSVYGESKDSAGRVVAVWPGLGMADVEFPTGTKRYPVEDLQRFTDEGHVVPPHTNSAPAGNQQVSVSGGPFAPAPNISRVARSYVKKSLYWADKDRKYRGNAVEVSSGKYLCPRCKPKGEEVVLKPATYKRRDGNSERLLGCPSCLFLVKKSDIINCPDNPVECEVEDTMAKDLNHEFDALVGGE